VKNLEKTKKIRKILFCGGHLEGPSSSVGGTGPPGHPVATPLARPNYAHPYEHVGGVESPKGKFTV